MSIVYLDALAMSGSYRTIRRRPINTTSGKLVGELSLVPDLFINRAMKSLHHGHSFSRQERAQKLQDAAEIFLFGSSDGMLLDDFLAIVSHTSGLSRSVVQRATHAIYEALLRADELAYISKPEKAALEWQDAYALNGTAVWTPKGKVFSVVAAGNHPGVNALWVEALALGYHVAVRPSRREPFTPHRIVSALRCAGFADDQIMFLPCEQQYIDTFIDLADLSLVYGSDEAVCKYAKNPNVLTQGPGRSKVVVADGRWEDHLEILLESVGGEGGVACINASMIFVNGDPIPLAKALTQRLRDKIPHHSALDRHSLSLQPLDIGVAINRFLQQNDDGVIWRPEDSVSYEQTGNDICYLKPSAFAVTDNIAKHSRSELPFPCVWVAPWVPSNGIDLFKHSLALSICGGTESLITQCVLEPSIANVYVEKPTTWMKFGVPHDGYLAEFLMRSKGVA